MRNLIFTFRKQAILLAMLFTGIVAMAEQITVTVTTTNGLQDAITALGAPAANAITDLKVICPSNTVYLGPT
ncbi:MAG: hypothetical protein LBG77_06115, partial [Dysgonamonadaceae bacterium]|nr:hypothetical protein [Dysgonamonadaceae bacterium]